MSKSSRFCRILSFRVAPNATGSHVTAEHLRKTNFPKKNLRLTNFPKKIHWQIENPKYWASHLCFRRSPREFARIVLDAQEFHGFQDIRLGAAKLRAKHAVSARMCASSLQINSFRAGCAEAPREIDNFGRGWRAGLPWLPRPGKSISHAEIFGESISPDIWASHLWASHLEPTDL